MKIAYCIRPNYLSGGDGIQATKTKQYIEKLYPDTQINVITSADELDSSYDLVHIFNYATVDISESFFRKAMSLELKIVSSPIYWDYSYAKKPLPLCFLFYKNFISEKYALFHRRMNLLMAKINVKIPRFSLFDISPYFQNKIRFFIENSDAILPNSEEEGQLCLEFANVKPVCFDKIKVIYNGVDDETFQIMSKELFFDTYQIPQDFLLQVGRVEYGKNQLNFLSAMFDYPEIPIVFLGNLNLKSKYARKIKKIANKRGNVFFVSNIPHENVYSFYYYAKTHVLLSLRESPGLVSLEALSQGCPIVVSDERFVPLRTYFSRQFEVANPYSKQSIVSAVFKSMKKEHIPICVPDFSWRSIARNTYLSYEEVIK